ncbi:MAG: hypothetical protein IT430_19330 [Phycisphaerales bacterium]|nr:hypothetical protein [Phycisphaerales bacterium]
MSIIVSKNDTAKPSSQSQSTGRVSTIELILSVTEAYVMPGRMTRDPLRRGLAGGRGAGLGWNCGSPAIFAARLSN